jgi:hypothetical protein
MKKAQVFLTCIFIAIWANVISFRGSAVVVASPGEKSTRHAVDDRELFVHRAAEIWGKENVWESSPTSWIQYESDLGERSAVDFENGTVRVRCERNFNPIDLVIEVYGCSFKESVVFLKQLLGQLSNQDKNSSDHGREAQVCNTID